MKNLLIVPALLIGVNSLASQPKILKKSNVASRFTISNAAAINPEELTQEQVKKLEMLMANDSDEDEDALYMETGEDFDAYVVRKNHTGVRGNSSEGDSSDGKVLVVGPAKLVAHVPALKMYTDKNSSQSDSVAPKTRSPRPRRGVGSRGSVGSKSTLWRKASPRVEDIDTGSSPSQTESPTSDERLSGINDSEGSKSPRSRGRFATIGSRGKNAELYLAQRSSAGQDSELNSSSGLYLRNSRGLSDQERQNNDGSEHSIDVDDKEDAVTALQLMRRKNAERLEKFEKRPLARLNRAMQLKAEAKFKAMLFSVDQELLEDSEKLIDIDMLSDLIKDADKLGYDCLKILHSWFNNYADTGRIASDSLDDMMNEALVDKANVKPKGFVARWTDEQRSIVLRRGELSPAKFDGMEEMGVDWFGKATDFSSTGNSRNDIAYKSNESDQKVVSSKAKESRTRVKINAEKELSSNDGDISSKLVEPATRVKPLPVLPVKKTMTSDMNQDVDDMDTDEII